MQKMLRVRVGDVVIAEAPTADIVRVEGNPYFPPSALKPNVTTPSDHTTVCGWKGTAKYLDIVAGGKTLRNAAWFYPEAKPAASNIKDYYAFYGHMVSIVEE